jgi:hypothetical protein
MLERRLMLSLFQQVTVYQLWHEAVPTAGFASNMIVRKGSNMMNK